MQSENSHSSAAAPRIAFMHTWLYTQTEGWWRMAFDKLQIPYDYINTQTVAARGELAREVRRDCVCPGRACIACTDCFGSADVGQCPALAKDRIDAESWQAGRDGRHASRARFRRSGALKRVCGSRRSADHLRRHGAVRDRRGLGAGRVRCTAEGRASGRQRVRNSSRCEVTAGCLRIREASWRSTARMEWHLR